MQFESRKTGRKAKVFEQGEVKSFLKVLDFAGRSEDNGELLYRVECLRPNKEGLPCGVVKTVRGQLLRSNQKVISCGCYFNSLKEEWEAKRVKKRATRKRKTRGDMGSKAARDEVNP